MTIIRWQYFIPVIGEEHLLWKERCGWHAIQSISVGCISPFISHFKYWMLYWILYINNQKIDVLDSIYCLKSKLSPRSTEELEALSMVPSLLASGCMPRSTYNHMLAGDQELNSGDEKCSRIHGVQRAVQNWESSNLVLGHLFFCCSAQESRWDCHDAASKSAKSTWDINLQQLLQRAASLLNLFRKP